MSIISVEKVSEIIQTPGSYMPAIEIAAILDIEKDMQTQNMFHLLTHTINRLKYNLDSPNYVGKQDEIISGTIQELKKGAYLPGCSISTMINILKTLNLYTSK